MRYTTSFLIVALTCSTGKASAQQEAPQNCDPAIQDCAEVNQVENLNLPPVGDAQNFIFGIGPVLGAVGGLAIATAARGGAATSTTSTNKK
ncbi:hypothetical protein O2N63_03195 [Aliiroseovarius sp. KMU-50]|uniref:Uncharacterized protein n=1 Tax=Aliiroseovarius salicola TaxID=3009082 RepID=A0ABT4VXW0_9RHOB|nr:hypothetical protein [Aliiroseovarius sp. KMU-50]MDA5093084.1 hypothetical protein [Aliiroseovarius sp. KMU-50]